MQFPFKVWNRIYGVIISVLSTSTVDHGFEPVLDKPNIILDSTKQMFEDIISQEGQAKG